MAKQHTLKVLNLDNILFNCRDILRSSRNSGSFFEKRDMMLTLIFLRFKPEKFEDGVKKLQSNLFSEGINPNDKEMQEAFFDDATFTDALIIYRLMSEVG